MSDKIITRNYGSIPHLSESKLTQQADKKISPGQEDILTKRARDWRDTIIVTEKVDGSNVGVYRDHDGRLHAITRAGYAAYTSPFEQHRFFDGWLRWNNWLFNNLPNGYRIVGEWMVQAHGTKYDMAGIPELGYFVAFDMMHDNERMSYIQFHDFCTHAGIRQVPLLHIGQPLPLKHAKNLLADGHYAPCEKPEGLVYRCERDGAFEFAAKWVRADKEDGKYMKDNIYNKGVMYATQAT